MARIGVFVCHCGHNIAGYLDVPSLVASAGKLPRVVCVQDSLFTCSDSGLAEIRTAIRDHNLNRVVVASCTPRTHEPLFKASVKEAGLNPYLLHHPLTQEEEQPTFAFPFSPAEIGGDHFRTAAVFLTQVATEQGWDRDTMLRHLARKAGLAARSRGSISRARLRRGPAPGPGRRRRARGGGCGRSRRPSRPAPCG